MELMELERSGEAFCRNCRRTDAPEGWIGVEVYVGVPFFDDGFLCGDVGPEGGDLLCSWGCLADYAAAVSAEV